MLQYIFWGNDLEYGAGLGATVRRMYSLADGWGKSDIAQFLLSDKVSSSPSILTSWNIKINYKFKGHNFFSFKNHNVQSNFTFFLFNNL
jgi:hypothetical protein